MDDEDIVEEDEEKEDFYNIDTSSRYFDTAEELVWLCEQNNGVVKGIKL